TCACGPDYFRPEFLSRRRSAKQYGTLWQHRFWEHCLRDEQDSRLHLDYLHANPLRHGLVSAVADWPWSSFHRWVRQGAYPVEWAGSSGKSEREGEHGDSWVLGGHAGCTRPTGMELFRSPDGL